jgi:hypothetical protein
MSPSQGRYYTQNNANTEKKHTNIHALSGIRNHEPIVREGEDGSWLRPRGHCDGLFILIFTPIIQQNFTPTMEALVYSDF